MPELYFYDHRNISTIFFEQLKCNEYEVECDDDNNCSFPTENPAVLFMHRGTEVSDECLLNLIRNNSNLNVVLYSTNHQSIAVPENVYGRIHKVEIDYSGTSVPFKRDITRYITQDIKSYVSRVVPESLLALYLLKIASEKNINLIIPNDIENRAKVEYKTQMGSDMPENYTLEDIKQAVDKYYDQR